MHDLIIIGGGPSEASAGRRAGKLDMIHYCLRKKNSRDTSPVVEGFQKMLFLI
jgi:hypothetical protein